MPSVLKSLATAMGAWAVAVSVLAQSGPTPSPADDPKLPAWRRTSQCAAVMKREIVVLAERYRAGTPQVKPEMVRLAELSFALIGTAFKQGLRKPQADKLLAEAEIELKSLAPEAQRALLQACQAEGQRAFKDANFIERSLVSNRANARIEDMLKPR